MRQAHVYECRTIVCQCMGRKGSREARVLRKRAAPGRGAMRGRVLWAVGSSAMGGRDEIRDERNEINDEIGARGGKVGGAIDRASAAREDGEKADADAKAPSAHVHAGGQAKHAE